MPCPTGRQRGDSTFSLVNEEAEKAAPPPPVPAVDVPESVERLHPLVRATRKAFGRSQTVVDTRGKPEVIPLHLSRPLVDRQRPGAPKFRSAPPPDVRVPDPCRMSKFNAA